MLRICMTYLRTTGCTGVPDTLVGSILPYQVLGKYCIIQYQVLKYEYTIVAPVLSCSEWHVASVLVDCRTVSIKSFRRAAT